jgi:glucosamine--fructose-6-phosphate aminotransferase (isomerizing)
MCGIVGYTGSEQATPILMRGLGRLEYRGYDSAGVAVFDGENLCIKKAKGKLGELQKRIEQEPVFGTMGIGHTRWATHGVPSDVNSHPHTDDMGNIAVVHNGIIENYLELKEALIAKGCTFASQTDTEVVAHLLNVYDQGDMLKTLCRIIAMLQGSFALAIVCKSEPETIYCVRKDSPLVIGRAAHGSVLASDIPALLEYTRDVYLLEDYDIAVLSPDSVAFYDVLGNAVHKTPMHVSWDVKAAEKGGFEHFMLKEIHEEPAAIRNTLAPLVENKDGQLSLRQDVMPITADLAKKIERIVISACGTAYHAGHIARIVFEQVAGIPTEVEIASEFRYRNPIIVDNTLFIVVSQSGETADTIAALREAKNRGVPTVAITNVVGSTVAREADHVIHTWAGPEIAVASTKAFVSQLMVVYAFAADLAQKRGKMDDAEVHAYLCELQELSPKAQTLVDNWEEYARMANQFRNVRYGFYIGRNLDFTLAMEAALKLKEISYVQTEAYPAGELKHGTLSLVEEGTMVLAIATQTALVDKMINNIKEVKVRGGYVVALIANGDLRVKREVDECWEIPPCRDLFSPVLVTIPTQLFAYYMALERGCEIDQPRNLAKSVTVE